MVYAGVNISVFWCIFATKKLHQKCTDPVSGLVRDLGCPATWGCSVRTIVSDSAKRKKQSVWTASSF